MRSADGDHDDMNTQHHSLFRKLDPEEDAKFRKAAREDFADADDEFLVKSIFHPAYRHEIGLLLTATAAMELETQRDAQDHLVGYGKPMFGR